MADGLLSHFKDMQPTNGKMSFVDSNGNVITLKIEDSKPKRKFWDFWPRKKTGQPTQSGKKGYKATISVDRCGTTQQQQAGASGNVVFHQGDDYPAVNEDYEHIADSADSAQALPPTGVDTGGCTPPPDASSSGSSEEDNYDTKCKELYNDLKRRASNGYANVRVNKEPLYSSVSKRPPPPPRDTPPPPRDTPPPPRDTPPPPRDTPDSEIAEKTEK